MGRGFRGILIVVPTRNRAALALNAIRSVLGQDCPQVQVMVSDNSTSAEEARRLARFCEELAHPRLSYVQPPEPLPMSPHWDWAIEQAMQRSTASHFIYLTDRMLMRPGELRRLTEFLSVHPHRVVSYNHDRIVDHVRPIRVQLLAWTGQLYEIESRELLSLISRSVLYHPALPKMLNCAVPREILTTIRERFGTVFDSVSPDFNFCFRCLDTVEAVLYHDRSVLVHYALDRSNGMGFERGVLTPDHKDFLETLGAVESLYFATPAPEVQTVGNAIFHEYCTVKQQTGSARFPEVAMGPYLDYLGEEVERLEVAEFRERMRSLLARYGWREPVLGLRQQRAAAAVAALGLPERRARAVARFAAGVAHRGPVGFVLDALRGLGAAIPPGNLWAWLGERLRLPIPRPDHLRFWNRDAAVEFALRSTPPRSSQPYHLPGRLHPLPEPKP